MLHFFTLFFSFFLSHARPSSSSASRFKVFLLDSLFVDASESHRTGRQSGDMSSLSLRTEQHGLWLGCSVEKTFRFLGRFEQSLLLDPWRKQGRKRKQRDTQVLQFCFFSCSVSATSNFHRPHDCFVRLDRDLLLDEVVRCRNGFAERSRPHI